MTNIWHFLSKVYFLNFCYVFWLNLKRLIRQNRPMIDDKNVLINQYLKIFDTVQYSIRLIHVLWILIAIASALFCQDLSITKKMFWWYIKSINDMSKVLLYLQMYVANLLTFIGCWVFGASIQTLIYNSLHRKWLR